MSAESPVSLVAGLNLDLNETQHRQLASLLETLAADVRAPTAISEPARAIEVHVADSLAGLEVDALCRARTIADLGSGSGFPGIALAIALPRARLRLIESRARACAFLERALAAARVENAEVVCARAEEWVAGALVNDAVVARALAPQPVVLEYAAPLLRIGGTFVDWRGARSGAEEAAGAVAAHELGLERGEIRRVEPFTGARDRHLHVFRKTGSTPLRFPRRPGIARKRPLA
jgi:16S rRNA (guanine527-N7)-methyltransferase